MASGPTVAVLGAAGYAGAVAAALLHRHPEFGAHARDRAAATPARASTRSPRSRVPLTLKAPATDLDVDAAVVAFARRVRADRIGHWSAGSRRRPVRGLPPARPGHLRALVRRAPGAHLIAEAVYGLPERYREQIRRVTRRHPGCCPTAAILALAPLVGSSRTWSSTPSQESRAPGRGRPRKHFAGAVDEAVTPYKVGAHRPRPRSRRARRARDVHAAPRAALARRGSSPATSGRTGTSTRALSQRLRGRAVGGGRRGPAGHDRGARDQRFYPHLVHEDPLRLIVFMADRQPLQGRRPAGGPEPQPDVRPRRSRWGSRRGVRREPLVDAPAHVSRPSPALQGFRAAGVALPRLQAEQRPRPRAAGLGRAGHHERRMRARACSPHDAAHAGASARRDPRVVANAGNANAAHGPARGGGRRAHAGQRLDGRPRARGPGRGHLDGHDRRPARRRQGDQGHPRRAFQGLAPYGEDTFSEAIRTTDKFAKSASLDVALLRHRRQPHRPRARG